jgi:sterol desaturase/sphingolipid hydroxylase (fatty acid hydroxylase superfamily)
MRDAVRIAVAVPVLLGFAWVSSVVVGAAMAVSHGVAIDTTLLTQSPAGWTDALVFGLTALVLLVDRWANGPDMFRNLLARSRYDLFFAIASATGAMTAMEVLFSAGLAAWLGETIGTLPSSNIMRAIPFAAQFVILYVMSNFFDYWAHRFLHTKRMWPIHAMHHAAQEFLSFTTSRVHPLEALVRQTVCASGLTLIGFGPDAVFALLVVGSLQDAITHSNAPYPRWLEPWIAGPAAHRVHHSADAAYYNRNFSEFAVWDRLFGTFALPEDARRLPMGVGGVHTPTDNPIADMLTAMRLWLRGIAGAFRIPSALITKAN